MADRAVLSEQVSQNQQNNSVNYFSPKPAKLPLSLADRPKLSPLLVYSGSPFEIGSAHNTWKLAYSCTNSFFRKCLYPNFFNFGMKRVNLNEIYYTNFYKQKCSLANLLISHKIVILNACANNFL